MDWRAVKDEPYRAVESSKTGAGQRITVDKQTETRAQRRANRRRSVASACHIPTCTQSQEGRSIKETVVFDTGETGGISVSVLPGQIVGG